MSPRLRQADRDEVLAASGMQAGDALVYAVEHSRQSDAWLHDGRPVAIAGVVDCRDAPHIGVIWMLASDEVEQFPQDLMQGNREYVVGLLNAYDMLLNFVDNRNIKAQNWLRWLGFTLEEPAPYGVAGLPFRQFWMRKATESGPRQDAIERDDDVRLIV